MHHDIWGQTDQKSHTPSDPLTNRPEKSHTITFADKHTREVTHHHTYLQTDQKSHAPWHLRTNRPEKSHTITSAEKQTREVTHHHTCWQTDQSRTITFANIHALSLNWQTDQKCHTLSHLLTNQRSHAPSHLQTNKSAGIWNSAQRHMWRNSAQRHCKWRAIWVTQPVIQQDLYHRRELPQVSFLSWQKFCCNKTRVCHNKTCLLLRQKYACLGQNFCCNKILFVMTKKIVTTKFSSWQRFVATNICLLRQTYFCRDKSKLVVTKPLLQQIMFDEWFKKAYFCCNKRHVLPQQTPAVCHDKDILVAAPNNERPQHSCTKSTQRQEGRTSKGLLVLGSDL